MDYLLLDDFAGEKSKLHAEWEGFTDQVMGGVSDMSVVKAGDAVGPYVRMRGKVSLDNNGGFIQVSLDLAEAGRDCDASMFEGVAITLRGDGGSYAVNLRTADLRYPWQSYRCALVSSATWQEFQLPFSEFLSNRTTAPLDATRLRRIGLIAIGEERDVDVAISRLGFYGSRSIQA